MFTILIQACAVAACTIISGPVDWTKPHSSDLIWVAGAQVIIGHEFAGAAADDPDQARSGKLIERAVGSRPVVCKGKFGSHGTLIEATCYFRGLGGQVINVAEALRHR